MSAAPFPDLDTLLQRLLDGQIQADEMKRLQDALLEDPRLQDYYLDSIFVCTVMRRCSQVTAELSESDLIRVLSGGRRQGGAGRIARHFYSIAAILIIGILILGSFRILKHWTRGPTIGALTDAYEAQWRGSDPLPGAPLYAGLYNLREGAVMMKLNQGTRLLLEAPCRIELMNVGEMSLRSGRLTVMVSPLTTGFLVHTHTALITDLGTEFGVIVRPDGRTEAHVLKGRIRVALDPNRSGRQMSRVVNEGLAALVDADGRTMQGGLAARPDCFLLELPLPSRPAGPGGRINLADIVGGGNGRGTGTSGEGIDLKDGNVFRYPATRILQAQQNRYHPSPQFRGIDGTFVPNGGMGPVVISSTGLVFSACPRTMGSYFGGPVNSGRFYDLPSQQYYTARLNGVRFGTARHPAMILHPNAGITFDLDQIRQDQPNIRIGRFTALCGMPKDLPQPQFSSADVWVLLDGVVVRHLRYPIGQSVVEKMDVPISAQTRFLTLAATCSGRADYSWIFFGDPFLGPAALVPQETIP